MKSQYWPRNRAVLALFLVSLAGLLWWWRERPAPSPPPSGIAFEETTTAAGIAYRGTSFGAAWGDADGDGDPDLWASGHSPQRLLINEGDGRFSDRTAARVSPIRYSDRHNAAWADFDNDGDADLLQLSGADRGHGTDPNALYVNRDGQLTDRGQALGLAYGRARARAALWFDKNRDGLLDVLITAAPRPEAPPALFLQTKEGFRGTPLGYLERSETAQLAMLSRDPQLQIITGLPHTLLVHGIQGDRLRDVGESLHLPKEIPPWTTDLLVGDLDNDGFQDLVFVRGGLRPAVQQPDPQHLRARLQSYWGRPQRITLSGPNSLRVSPYPLAKQWWGQGRIFIGAHGRDPADIPIDLDRRDPSVIGLAAGEKGLFLGYDAEAETWMIEMRDPTWNSVNLQLKGAEPITGFSSEGFESHIAALDQPIRWNRGGHFEAREQVLTRDNCFSGALGDFDNDGDLDLYLVCGGYLENRPNRLFENLGDRRFREVPDAGGASGSLQGIGDSVAVADYDLDGFLDLFVRNGRGLVPFGRGPDQLFRNRGGSHHWIELDLAGDPSNRDGIGARVVLTLGGARQLRVATGGIHGRVQDFHRLHFGLGTHERVTAIQVDWPSGNRTRYDQLAGDRVWILREDGRAAPRVFSGAPGGEVP